MTLTGYFALKSVFAPVWLAETVCNCVQTNKDRHILSAVHISGRDSGFWQYKVCADIRSVGFSRKEILKDSEVAH